MNLNLILFLLIIFSLNFSSTESIGYVKVDDEESSIDTIPKNAESMQTTSIQSDFFFNDGTKAKDLSPTADAAYQPVEEIKPVRGRVTRQDEDQKSNSSSKSQSK